MSEQAHCLVCNRPGASTADFLCGACADPNKIIATCACGARYEIDPGSALAQTMSSGLKLAIKAGTAIKSAHCHKCSAAEETEVTCFNIRRSDA